jgi:hypothetical protein
MRHRGLYTAYGIGVALVTIGVMVGLLLVNAAEETQAFAIVVLVCLAGMGVSALAVRYPP